MTDNLTANRTPPRGGAYSPLGNPTYCHRCERAWASDPDRYRWLLATGRDGLLAWLCQDCADDLALDAWGSDE